jgi:hypothetical protein
MFLKQNIFFVVFEVITDFKISGCLQETILKSYEDKSGVSISAYLSQAIQCISGAFACLYSPIFISWASPKRLVTFSWPYIFVNNLQFFLKMQPFPRAFVVAGAIHLFYTTSYILPNPYSIYIISAFLGSAGSLIWALHGITGK